jgi:CheY-like chemotaxis protein
MMRKGGFTMSSRLVPSAEIRNELDGMQDDEAPQAIVIESNIALADMVGSVLKRLGYAVAEVATHADGAKKAMLQGRVDLAVASVPIPGEDPRGAFLQDARRTNPSMRLLVMLSCPLEPADGAPAHAATLVKPFTAAELQLALECLPW